MQQKINQLRKITFIERSKQSVFPQNFVPHWTHFSVAQDEAAERYPNKIKF